MLTRLKPPKSAFDSEGHGVVSTNYIPILPRPHKHVHLCILSSAILKHDFIYFGMHMHLVKILNYAGLVALALFGVLDGLPVFPFIKSYFVLHKIYII